MSIQTVDLRKLVKIVRQYEVIYGGGISSGDAAIREECENLVSLLESELSGSKVSGSKENRAMASLPSLIDAKKKLKDTSSPRPIVSRAAELASLTTSKPGQKGVAVKADKPKADPPVKKASTSTTSVAKSKSKVPEKSVGKKAVGKATAVKAASGKKALPAGGAGVSKAVVKAAKEEDAVYKDVRSRHVVGVKAAAERSDRIAGNADSSDEAETKKRFAALHLFDAFQQNRLPKYGGFIVCIRFSEVGYTVIEIIGYGNMQDLYPDGESIVFKSVGCKLYALVEPSGYLQKSVEPVNRPSGQMIPYRFAELLRITTKRFQGILVGRKPVFMPTSFAVIKPEGEDLAVLFYDIADVYSNIQDFLIMIFRDRLGVPVIDSRKAAEVIARGIREFRLWMDET